MNSALYASIIVRLIVKGDHYTIGANYLVGKLLNRRDVVRRFHKVPALYRIFWVLLTKVPLVTGCSTRLGIMLPGRDGNVVGHVLWSI